MYKALIIDDEKPVVTAISALIDWDSYSIYSPLYVASDGESGMEIMQQIHPEIVFVDMNMPIMNGTEFLKKASIDYPKTIYIVISGYDEFSYAQTAIQNGAIDYILKPVDYHDLNRALEKGMKILEPDNNQVNAASAPIEPDYDNNLNPQKAIPLIKNYIEENYCTDITIKLFSDKYFVSKEYLSKLFKESYGVGIYEYVLTLRMKKARELLNNTDMQIQEISTLLGYSNNNYFSKAFKTYYGLSPTEYREKE